MNGLTQADRSLACQNHEGRSAKGTLKRQPVQGFAGARAS